MRLDEKGKGVDGWKRRVGRSVVEALHGRELKESRGEWDRVE